MERVMSNSSLYLWSRGRGSAHSPPLFELWWASIPWIFHYFLSSLHQLVCYCKMIKEMVFGEKYIGGQVWDRIFSPRQKRGGDPTSTSIWPIASPDWGDGELWIRELYCRWYGGDLWLHPVPPDQGVDMSLGYGRWCIQGNNNIRGCRCSSIDNVIKIKKTGYDYWAFIKDITKLYGPTS